MTISVAGRPLQSIDGLSEPARLVLGLIDGGRQWFAWAIGNPRARYGFDDEAALVAGVQSGLHASPLLLLPKIALIVGPARLMSFDPGDLRAVAEAESGEAGAPNAAKVARILAAEGLVTQSDLAGGPAFLAEIGVADAPVFQCPSFDDRLAIRDIASESTAGDPKTRALQREAAAFALAQGRTPQEFADYYQAYLAAAAGAARATPAARTALVRSAVETLLPLLFGALDCPRVDGLPAAPWQVGPVVDEWLMTGRIIGFARLSLAVQQVIANGGFAQQTGEDARRIVNAYLGAAQALLRSAPLGEGLPGQDGMSRSFRVERDGEQAILHLGADGTIALASYRPKTP